MTDNTYTYEQVVRYVQVTYTSAIVYSLLKRNYCFASLMLLLFKLETTLLKCLCNEKFDSVFYDPATSWCAESHGAVSKIITTNYDQRKYFIFNVKITQILSTSPRGQIASVMSHVRVVNNEKWKKKWCLNGDYSIFPCRN